MFFSLPYHCVRLCVLEDGFSDIITIYLIKLPLYDDLLLISIIRVPSSSHNTSGSAVSKTDSSKDESATKSGVQMLVQMKQKNEQDHQKQMKMVEVRPWYDWQL